MATFLKPQNFSQTLFLWKDRFVTYVNTFSNHLENSLADIDAMDRRLRARLSYIEFAGLVLGCAMIAIFVYLMRIKAGGPVDFIYYMNDTIRLHFVYGYWLLPVFELLRLLPLEVAYVLWCLINLCGAFFAVRVFGGKPGLVIMSYQLLTCFYYGQISGFLAGGFALGWYGITHKRWDLAGAAFMFVAAKYQVGVPLGLLFVWYSGIPFKKWLRLLPMPIIIFVLSLMIYPAWPALSMIKMSSMTNYLHLGITFWIYLGTWALLFWIPALLLPISKTHRFLALFCLASFAVPYFQHIDLLTLFAFPLGWLPAIGYVGVLFPFLDMTAIRLTAIVPFSIYLLIILPASIRWIRSLRKSKTHSMA